MASRALRALTRTRSRRLALRSQRRRRVLRAQAIERVWRATYPRAWELIRAQVRLLRDERLAHRLQTTETSSLDSWST
jgi:hypothetical protein